MLGNLIRSTLRKSPDHIRHVAPVRRGAARGIVAKVYRQAERDFGMLPPPLSLHSPAPEALAACWLILRETLLAAGQAGRPAKEAVATAVSLGNDCPYCVEVHSTTLHGLLDIQRQAEPIDDPAVREIVAWGRAGETLAAAARHEVPFPLGQWPELVGVAITFQYLNRMVHVFLGESALPRGVPAAARGRALLLLARYLRWATVDQAREPGASLDLLPAAPLPPDLTWAVGNPSISGAFARAAAAIETVGARSVPESARSLVLAELAGWDGQPVGLLGHAWVDDAVSGLPTSEQSSGRLALLVAFAAHQVGKSDIDEFRRHHPADQTLIELTSWAAMAAARRIGSWQRIHPAPPETAQVTEL